jgi:hypothetical protein
MPTTKQIFGCQITQHTFNRIQLLDSMLFRHGHLPGRDELLKMVMRRLGRKIAPRTLDADINKIREMLKDQGGKVELINDHNGYRYSDKGFSLFKCPLSEEDPMLLAIGVPLLRRYFGEDYARWLVDLCKRLKGMVPDSEPGAFMEMPADAMLFESDPCEKEARWMRLILAAVRDRSPLRAVLKGYGDRDEHLSPYRLVEGRKGIELVAHRYDPTGLTEGRIDRFPLSDLKELSPSNKPFMAEDRFVADREGMATVHRFKQRSEEEGYEGMDDQGIRA